MLILGVLFFLLVFFSSQKLEECIKPSVTMILNSLASTLTMGKVHAVSFIYTGNFSLL